MIFHLTKMIITFLLNMIICNYECWTEAKTISCPWYPFFFFLVRDPPII